MEESQYKAFVGEMERCINERMPMTESDVKSFILGWITGNTKEVDSVYNKWVKEHPEQVQKLLSK